MYSPMMTTQNLTVLLLVQPMLLIQINLQTVLDLSLQGALIKKPEQWPPSLPKLMQLRIQLNDLPVELTMKVSVAHESGNVVGLHCEKIDIESVSHLRRLLELNLGDAELLSRELSELSEH